MCFICLAPGDIWASTILPLHWWLITLRPRQNGRHFADDIFKCIFLNENVWIPIEISLTFVPKDLINNIPALVQIMAWRPPGDKPLSEPMVVSLLMHICVTQSQWIIARLQHLQLLMHWKYSSIALRYGYVLFLKTYGPQPHCCHLIDNSHQLLLMPLLHKDTTMHGDSENFWYILNKLAA